MPTTSKPSDRNSDAKRWPSGSFSMIPMSCVDALGSAKSVKAVVFYITLVLESRKDDSGRRIAKASQADLAAKLGVSKRTIMRYVGDLVAAGLIIKLGGKTGPNRALSYEIVNRQASEQVTPIMSPDCTERVTPTMSPDKAEQVTRNAITGDTLRVTTIRTQRIDENNKAPRGGVVAGKTEKGKPNPELLDEILKGGIDEPGASMVACEFSGATAEMIRAALAGVGAGAGGGARVAILRDKIPELIERDAGQAHERVELRARLDGLLDSYKRGFEVDRTAIDLGLKALGFDDLEARLSCARVSISEWLGGSNQAGRVVRDFVDGRDEREVPELRALAWQSLQREKRHNGTGCKVGAA